MYYFLFILFAALGYFGITKTKLRKASGLSVRSFSIVFILKVLIAAFVAYVFSHYQPGNDYLVFHQEGYLEYELLKKDPATFFTNITDSFYSNKYGNFFSSVGSFWNDLRNNLIIKLVAILDIITLGNFYLNCLLFSLLTFCGQLAMFNFLKQVLQKDRTAAFIASFLLPSALLFTAAAHKDGIIFMALAFFSLAFYNAFKKGFTAGNIIGLLFCFSILFLIRSYVAFIAVAACILFVLTLKLKYKPIYIIGSFILAAWLSLFILERLAPDFKPLNLIVQKQTEFLAIEKANTQIDIPLLTPDLLSLTKAAPGAVTRAVLHPNPFAFKNPVYLFFAMENCVYLILFLLYFILHKKIIYTPLNKSSLIYCLCITSLIFLFIGYTIPASGAILRYKSIYLPYVMGLVLAGINWEKLKNSIQIKNKNI